MSNFRKDIFEQKLRILRFDLDANHSKEFKDFCELHRKNGTDRGSYFYDLRSEIKGKHFRSILENIIQCLINTFPLNTMIEKAEKEEIENIFHKYFNRIIEDEKNGLQSVMASRGLQSGSSIVVDTIKAFEYQLNRIKSYSKDILYSSIKGHNENVELMKQKVEKSVSTPMNRTDNILSKIKNHPILSIIIVLGITLIAIGQATDSFTKIRDFIFPKTIAIKQEEESLSVLIKAKNGFNKKFELNPLCEYEIMESEIARINILSQGRLHLIPKTANSDDEYIIEPNKVKEYIVTFPNPKMYSTLLDRGSANIHFILRSNDLKSFFICSAPFDRISLKKYFVECKLDSIDASN